QALGRRLSYDAPAVRSAASVPRARCGIASELPVLAGRGYSIVFGLRDSAAAASRVVFLDVRALALATRPHPAGRRRTRRPASFNPSMKRHVRLARCVEPGGRGVAPIPA